MAKLDFLSRKPKFKASHYKCGTRCGRQAQRFVSWFDITGEYNGHTVPICTQCWNGIQAERDIRRQMREMTASEDELISGDYES